MLLSNNNKQNARLMPFTPTSDSVLHIRGRLDRLPTTFLPLSFSLSNG
jgi:hypothetical protein